jgi:hypothetical protein
MHLTERTNDLSSQLPGTIRNFWRRLGIEQEIQEES